MAFQSELEAVFEPICILEYPSIGICEDAVVEPGADDEEQAEPH